MKKCLCWLMLLMMAAAAFAEQSSAGVTWGTVSLDVDECRIVQWDAPGETEGMLNALVQIRWKMGNSEPYDGNAYFFDVSDIAHSGSTAERAWKPGYDLRPGDVDLVMGMLPALTDQWVINETAELALTYAPESITFPFRTAFLVDVYEPINRTSDLRLDVLRWSMKKESDRIFVARPDVPELNGGSNTPKVLSDFTAAKQEGNDWEERLDYQRDRTQLRRTVMKINYLGKPAATWEVYVTFDGPDAPGRVEIIEVE